MTRLMIVLAGTAAMAGGDILASSPALAQQSSEITVYGTDPCPRSTNGQIFVCRRRPESERYRIPQSQNLQGTRQERQSWARKSQQLMTVGNTGGGTCSPVGPNGYTGCLAQEINQARRESNEQQQQESAPEK
jgi:uncharacterized protein YcfJ